MLADRAEQVFFAIADRIIFFPPDKNILDTNFNRKVAPLVGQFQNSKQKKPEKPFHCLTSSTISLVLFLLDT